MTQPCSSCSSGSFHRPAGMRGGPSSGDSRPPGERDRRHTDPAVHRPFRSADRAGRGDLLHLRPAGRQESARRATRRLLRLLPHMRKARGERLTGMLLAADRRQARILKSYISRLVAGLPGAGTAHRQRDERGDRSSQRHHDRDHQLVSQRSRLYAHLHHRRRSSILADDSSSDSDVEILNGVRPGLATTHGPLIVIDSLRSLGCVRRPPAAFREERRSDARVAGVVIDDESHSRPAHH